MKIIVTLLAAVTLFVAPLFSGCAAIDRSLLSPTVSTNAVSGAVSTNYTVAPKVSGIINTGETIAAVAPAPWGWIASGVLSLASIGLAQYARVKSNQASVIPAIIAGVESAANNDAVKLSIKNAATALGVQNQLHQIVQDQTSPQG